MKFIEKYDHPKNIRFDLFKESLKIANKRGLKTFVETGTARGKIKFFFIKKINWKDGMSTLMFAEFAKFTNGELHTCDISSNNIKNAKFFTKKLNKYISFYTEDSVSFLKKFPKKIDFLYLDSFDGHNVELASKHQLKEAKMAINKLTSNSLVVLDDKGSKTIYSLPFFIDNGFKIILETQQQVILSK